MSDNGKKLLDHVEDQVAKYREVREAYQVFAKVLNAVLSQAMKDLGLMAIVQSRAKDLASFAEKVVRKRDKYPHPVDQLTDLCGARVITETTDDLDPVCRFVQKHFEIYETEDVLERLGASEFGYRSIHFIVALKPGEFGNVLKSLTEAAGEPAKQQQFEAALRRLYERRTPEEGAATGLAPGAKFKAEVQVRTLLQHAWAAVGHDRIYKSEFKVPDRWRRDANRVAASLEAADEDFTRTVQGVASYRNYYGAYMTRKQREEELEKLTVTLQYDPENLGLALQIARMAMSLKRWEKVEETLRPFVEKWEASAEGQLLKECAEVLRSSKNHDEIESAQLRLEDLRDKKLAMALGDSGRAQWKLTHSGGREYLEWSTYMDPAEAEAHIALAETYLDEKDYDTALEHFERAYRAEPDEPSALAGFLYCRLLIDRSLDFVSLMRPSLEAAIERCRERARVKVYLPRAYYDIGLFALLLGDPYQALTAYAKASTLSETADTLVKPLEWIEQLQRVVGKHLPELDWVRRFLIAARVVKQPEAEAQTESEYGQALISVKSMKFPELTPPVVLVAGGTSAGLEQRLELYRSVLFTAFEGFAGTVLSGGTVSGIPGLVGDLPDTSGGLLRKVSCLPASVPTWTRVHPGYEIYNSTGSRFSPLEPVQAWIDLMASGVNPAAVKLLGINGGKISAFEFRLALALGAKVGLIADSGRAVSDIAEDEDWREAEGLLFLPCDPQTVKIFLQGIPPATVLDSAHREDMARQAHEDYQTKQKKPFVSQEPALADWKDLSPGLQESNRNQIDHLEEKLRAIGMKLRKVPPEEAQLMEFTEEQVELMSEMEHGRWNAERLMAGWTLGPKDVVAKRSPYLVAWSDLTEEVKGFDRNAVRALPEMLKSLGYEIVPKDEAATEE